MTEKECLELANQIFQQILERDCLWDLKTIQEKLAFDINLPTKVVDAMGSETWVAAANAERYITQKHSIESDKEIWSQNGLKLNSMSDLISAWQKINHFTTERIMDSENVTKSDTIYSSENIYHSVNCFHSKNLIFCDNCANCEANIASSRSSACNFSIRVEDSAKCSNSFNVIYSNKVVNSLFIQDCADMYECMFCAHQSAKRFCIANQEFEKEEYFAIKKRVIEWILR